ncbi:Alkaline phosphatase synthesis sensor protein PhoR [compost metagenome]
MHLFSEALILVSFAVCLLEGLLFFHMARQYRRDYACPYAWMCGAAGLFLGVSFFARGEAPAWLAALWAGAYWVLVATATEFNLRLTQSRLTLRPYAGWIGLGSLALSLLVVYPAPYGPAAQLTWLATAGASSAIQQGLFWRFWRRSPTLARTILLVSTLFIFLAYGCFGLSPRWPALLLLSTVLLLVALILQPIGCFSLLFESVADELKEQNRQVAEERQRVSRLVEERTAELAEANAYLEATLADLRRLDRHKDEFFSVVSHELRTPVAAILGFGEFLEDRLAGDLSPGQEEFVAGILSATRQLARLVDDLLDVARIAGGTLRLEPRLTSLSDLLAQAIAIATPLCERKRQRLNVSIAPDLPLIHGDPQRLIQVVLNLLSNASKFSPEGSDVSLRAEQEPGGALIAVSDQGIGIDPQEHAFVFDRFYQSDRSLTRRRGGVGLGLAIARELVAMHGGRITLESALGQGATFRIHLPVTAATGPLRV